MWLLLVILIGSDGKLKDAGVVPTTTQDECLKLLKTVKVEVQGIKAQCVEFK